MFGPAEADPSSDPRRRDVFACHLTRGTIPLYPTMRSRGAAHAPARCGTDTTIGQSDQPVGARHAEATFVHQNAHRFALRLRAYQFRPSRSFRAALSSSASASSLSRGPVVKHRNASEAFEEVCRLTRHGFSPLGAGPSQSRTAFFCRPRKPTAAANRIRRNPNAAMPAAWPNTLPRSLGLRRHRHTGQKRDIG